MTFKLGTTSRAKLVGVHPDLVRVVKRALQVSKIDFKVICGLRTIEEQRILVRTGKSMTLKSRHLTGHAVDIVPLPVDWHNLLAFRTVALAMAAAARQEGVPLEWGGDWARFVDMPHFQLPWDQYP